MKCYVNILCNRNSFVKLLTRRPLTLSAAAVKCIAVLKAGAKGGPGGLAPPNRHTWPINKLTLLKTATSVLNFKVWPPLRNGWPPKSTALPPALAVLVKYCAITCSF